MAITLGPLLGYEWDSKTSESYYTVLIRAEASAQVPAWEIEGQKIALKRVANLGKERLWRGEIKLSPFSEAAGREIAYRVLDGATPLVAPSGEKRWAFWLPGKGERPRIAYASCNGFSSAKLAMNTKEPNAMWDRMKSEHDTKDRDSGPFSLLLMGGDQLYCDEVLEQTGLWTKTWSFLSAGEQKKFKPTEQDLDQLRAFYRDQYVRRWCGDGAKARPASMMNIMATVPSVMMWDDHDIFDGYGSHNEFKPEQKSFYDNVFAAAREFFALYQIRSAKDNRSLLRRGQETPAHFSCGLRFGPHTILALDNRSERTLDQIMSASHWNEVIAWVQAQLPKSGGDAQSSLLVLTGIPVVYRRFGPLAQEPPGFTGLRDDVHDHWNVPQHVNERDRLIHYLFAWLRKNELSAGFAKVLLLSGDVHVGALGRLKDEVSNRQVTQVVSTGIVHPPPTWVEWQGLQIASSDSPYEIKGQGIEAEMITPAGTNDRYLRTRNFAWLKQGDDGKLWVNWNCEDDQNPYYPIA